MTKRNRQQLILISIFTMGLLIMSYPLYSNAINRVWDSTMVKRYSKQEAARFEQQKQALLEHNEMMAQGGFAPGSDPFDESNTDYEKLDGKEHFLGTIAVPRLNLEVPLFDTTTPDLLEIGATVLDGTSQPLGGANTHSVITGHRGLPNRELFTNIPKLEVGNVFIVDVFGEQLAYEVIESLVVLPHETDSLKIVEGQDLITLVTCTPYMINTHRLLLTGTRVELTPEIETQLTESLNQAGMKHMVIISALIIIILGFLIFVIRMLLRKRKTKVILNKG